MTKKQNFILLAVLTVVCGILVFLQYQSQKSKHERLAANGLQANIVALPYQSMGVTYAHYYFITQDGQKIEGHRKCAKDFYRYLTATAIYNPSNPNEYDLSFDFEHYFPTWRIIFFFFIYLPATIFVSFFIVQFGIMIYKRLKNANG